MPMNTRSKKYPAANAEEARAAIARRYQALQLDWAAELQNEPTDWPRLLSLHYELADLERRAPWLRKEVA